MSTRWMMVQYVGNTLRLPVANEGNMDRPFGSSVLERDVRRIVVNPFSDNPQTFVPESENAKLREMAVGMYGLLVIFDKMLGNHDACETPRPLVFGEDKSFKDVMRELGIEVD